MEIRQLTLDDLPQQRWLMDEAFGGGMRSGGDGGFDPSPSLMLGAFENGKLVASATVHGLHVTWDSRNAPLGGVAGVACTVGARGQGHVGRLLIESLQVMRSAGQYLSGLYPFSYAFYRRYGWEWVGEKRHYTVPTTAVAAAPEGLDVRTYDGPDALDVVKPIYAAFARRYHGMMTREDPAPDWWKARLEHGGERTTYVHVHHDPETGVPDGYFTFRYPEQDRAARIGEFFALNPSAYCGLLSVIHYYGTQIKTIEVTAPADDPMPIYVMHHDMKMHVTPLFMGRIVDLSAAFIALKPSEGAQGAMTIQVHDPSCEWNDLTFEMTVDDGQVAVSPTGKTPGITLDIQALAQAYWAAPSLAILRRAGRLSVSNENHYGLLSALLPSAVPYLHDFF
jgi:predicted acetyltransferase